MRYLGYSEEIAYLCNGTNVGCVNGSVTDLHYRYGCITSLAAVDVCLYTWVSLSHCARYTFLLPCNNDYGAAVLVCVITT